MIETSSDLFQSSLAIFGKSSEMFGKSSETFVWLLEQFWKIFRDLRKVVGNLRKIVTFYIIKRDLHGRTEIRNSSSPAANEWNIFQHSKINFVSLRSHVISSISLPSPPPEIQVKNKTGDGSGYTLQLKDTLIHWIISMQRKLTFFPNYNSGRDHWILNSIDINQTHKVLLLFSQG